jgi:hypothetical protein
MRAVIPMLPELQDILNIPIWDCSRVLVVSRGASAKPWLRTIASPYLRFSLEAIA